MPYTTPPTFASGDTLLASDLQILSDDISYLAAGVDAATFSGTLVGRSAATSISNATDTTITFTAETFDFGSWWSSGSNVTVPAGAIPAGYTTVAILFIARTKFASNNTGSRKLTVLQNGSAYLGSSVGAVDGADTEIIVTGFTTAAAGDTFSLEVRQTSGGSLNVSGTTLTVVRFAAAS